MKKIVRLTENDLHRIIKESVKKILKEGSVVNHNPMFYYNRDNSGARGVPNGVGDSTWYPAKPGQRADASNFDFDGNGNFHPGQDPMTAIHNERASKYRPTGDYDNDGSPKFEMEGDPSWVEREMKNDLQRRVRRRKGL